MVNATDNIAIIEQATTLAEQIVTHVAAMKLAIDAKADRDGLMKLTLGPGELLCIGDAAHADARRRDQR